MPDATTKSQSPPRAPGADAENILDFKGPINLNVSGSGDPVRLEMQGGAERPVAIGVTAQIKELAPVLVQLLIQELPRLQLVAPHNYRLGLTVFGVELFSISLTGETRMDLSSPR